MKPREGNRLHVCLVSSAYLPYPSGVSEHVHSLAGALRDRGHRIHILTTSYPGTREDSFPVTRLGRAIVLPANRSRFTLPVGWRLARDIREFLARSRFDIVHCHGIFPPETAYWAARYSTAPTVVTFHTFGLKLPGIVRTGFRTAFRGLARKVRARIAVSQAGRTWAEQWFPGPYHVIPNGVDTGRFTPHAPRPDALAGGNRYILFVGRLEQRKGLPVLLKALPGILKRIPKVRLVVVGSGPQERECRRLCGHLGITAAVDFAGTVPASELPGYYAHCSVFASPALGSEAMGIVLIEAMAAGRPVVASRIQGYDEVIRDGVDGLLVPPGDNRAWTDAILAVLRSEELRNRTGSGALVRSRDFAWPGIAGRVEAVYREVLT